MCRNAHTPSAKSCNPGREHIQQLKKRFPNISIEAGDLSSVLTPLQL
jgi:hypothetical protein